jgi:arylformamidase
MTNNTVLWGPYDQAGLDRQYNNRAAVPEADSILEDLRLRGEAVRARHGASRLSYGTLPRQGIELIAPPKTGAGTVLFFPGGQWQFCDPQAGAFPADAVIAAGWRFAVADHRLLPEASLAQVCQDAVAAVQYTLRTLPGPFTLAGTSSGAHLALLAATDPGVLAHRSRLARLILVSGMYDLEPVRLSYRNAILKLSREAAVEMSPIHRISAAADSWKEAVFAVGECETAEFLRQTQAARAAWTPAGGKARHVILPMANHFDAIDRLPTAMWLG